MCIPKKKNKHDTKHRRLVGKNSQLILGIDVVFKQYYQDLFSTTNPTDTKIEECINCIKPKVIEEMNQDQ